MVLHLKYFVSRFGSSKIVQKLQSNAFCVFVTVDDGKRLEA